MWIIPQSLREQVNLLKLKCNAEHEKLLGWHFKYAVRCIQETYRLAKPSFLEALSWRQNGDGGVFKRLRLRSLRLFWPRQNPAGT